MQTIIKYDKLSLFHTVATNSWNTSHSVNNSTLYCILKSIVKLIFLTIMMEINDATDYIVHLVYN